MAASILSSAEHSRLLRAELAAATENLRALELSTGEAAMVREVALATLEALSTALFTDADAAHGRTSALAPLVEREIERVACLLGSTACARQAPTAGRRTR